MTNVLIRDLPESVHEQLLRRAQAEGQSLQQYLKGQLTALVNTPTLNEVLERISERQGGSVGFAQAVDDLAAVRPGHDER
jgi:plasmid stability protein